MANVAVIGAGVAGLTAAYRLRRLGHAVTVLEAKPHAGGLSQSVRDGDVITETGDDGRPVQQTVRLDPGLYVNSGPGRLPHHHRRILGLCMELGVALEPYIMSSDANYYVDARYRLKYRRRRIEHDARGYIAELAYSGDDSPPLQELVASFGDLDAYGRYRGTKRAGDGSPVPLPLLARLHFQNHLFWQPMSYLWQDAMFQPVGGMDAIWKALLRRVGDTVVYNAPVERIKTSNHGVKVTWRASGDRWSGEFDWCLSSIPFPQLTHNIRMDGFSRDYRDAVGTPDFAAACKVGWMSRSKWWQGDDEQIYGGISYSNHIIQQFWYPSADTFSLGSATLTGAYNAYEAAAAFGQKSVGERIALARRGGAMIHDQVADEDLVPGRNAVTVAWHRVPYQSGGWCDWRPSDSAHASAFATVQRPDGRFLAIGDQASSWPGWQEGCVATAEHGVALVQGEPPRLVDEVEVPDARWLTGGDHPWGPADYTIDGLSSPPIA
jgi:monoamine oxidase